MQYATTFRTRAVLFFCLLAFMGGCAETGGRSYTRNEAREVQTVQRGVITSVQRVIIEEDPTIVGTGIGGVAGGVIGSTMGQGSGRVLATLGGAIVGAAIGTFGEKAMRTENAYELEIRLDNGNSISVVQAVGEDSFMVGDAVRVLYSSSNRARVTHSN